MTTDTAAALTLAKNIDMGEEYDPGTVVDIIRSLVSDLAAAQANIAEAHAALRQEQRDEDVRLLPRWYEIDGGGEIWEWLATQPLILE